ANNATATLPLTLVVNTSGFNISTGSLPSGTVGSSYTANLTSAGGTGPYNYQVISGTLPAGVNLSSAGAFSGTPTTAGASTFTIRATDASNNTFDATYTVNVNNSGISLGSGSLPAGTTGTAYTS